jgi:hypothetical protein
MRRERSASASVCARPTPGSSRIPSVFATAQGQRADLAQHLGQVGKVTLTTDEAIRLRWQVAGQDRDRGLHGPSGNHALESGNI